MNSHGGPGERFAVMRAAHMAVLLDALDGVPVSDAERRTLEWLAGWDPATVENIAALFSKQLQR